MYHNVWHDFKIKLKQYIIWISNWIPKTGWDCFPDMVRRSSLKRLLAQAGKVYISHVQQLPINSFFLYFNNSTLPYICKGCMAMLFCLAFLVSIYMMSLDGATRTIVICLPQLHDFESLKRNVLQYVVVELWKSWRNSTYLGKRRRVGLARTAIHWLFYNPRHTGVLQSPAMICFFFWRHGQNFTKSLVLN